MDEAQRSTRREKCPWRAIGTPGNVVIRDATAIECHRIDE